MGGYCPNTGIAWFYRFSQHQLALPIHVLGSLADLVQISLNSGEIQGERYLAHLDNHSALGSLLSTRGVKYPKLNVLALLRTHALDLNGILAQDEFVGSEKSDLAGPLSRGLFCEFLERAKGKGFSKIRWVDVRRLVIPINLGSDRPSDYTCLGNEIHFLSCFGLKSSSAFWIETSEARD